jgi:hypothetical protein
MDPRFDREPGWARPALGVGQVDVDLVEVIFDGPESSVFNGNSSGLVEEHLGFRGPDHRVVDLGQNRGEGSQPVDRRLQGNPPLSV